MLLVVFVLIACCFYFLVRVGGGGPPPSLQELLLGKYVQKLRRTLNNAFSQMIVASLQAVFVVAKQPSMDHDGQALLLAPVARRGRLVVLLGESGTTR